MKNFLNEFRGPQFFVLTIFAAIVYFALYNPSADDKILQQSERFDRERIAAVEKAKNKNPLSKKAIEVIDWSNQIDEFASTDPSDPVAKKIREKERIRRMYNE
jgi:hypothetical protein